MKALLKRGVKFTDNALLMAAQGTRRTANTVDVYKYLVDELKLKPSVKDNDGNNLLHLVARKQNQLEVVTFLVSKGLDVNAQNNDKNNFLMLVAGGNDSELVKLALGKIKDVNTVNAKGESALTQAVLSGTSETVQLLLNKKADYKIKDNKGNNLAFHLIQSYRPARPGFGPANAAPAKDELGEKLNLLQKAGLNMSELQGDGSTLLHYAVTKGDLSLVKKVVELGGIDVNVQNEDEMTALHKAAITAQNDQILKYLISIGANKDLKTMFDETAYDFVKNNDYFKNNNIDISFLK